MGTSVWLWIFADTSKFVCNIGCNHMIVNFYIRWVENPVFVRIYQPARGSARFPGPRFTSEHRNQFVPRPDRLYHRYRDDRGGLGEFMFHWGWDKLRLPPVSPTPGGSDCCWHTGEVWTVYGVPHTAWHCGGCGLRVETGLLWKGTKVSGQLPCYSRCLCHCCKNANFAFKVFG